MGVFSSAENDLDLSLDQSQFFHHVDNINYSIIKEKNGDQYSGGIKEKQKHGRGILIFANHEKFNKYDGFWKNNKKHGDGTMYYKDGTIYKGQWENDMRNGEGVLYYYTGEKFKGNFKDDIKEGRGFFYSKNNKSIFLGNYKNDVKDGIGTTYYKKMDKISTEEWKNGVIISCEIKKGKQAFNNNNLFNINENEMFPLMRKSSSKNKLNYSSKEIKYNKTKIPNNFFVIMNLVIMTYTFLYDNGDINEWKEKTIIKLLEKLGIEKNKYNDIILNNQINGAKFLRLTLNDLKEYKITSIREQNIILKLQKFLLEFYERYFNYYREYQKEEEIKIPTEVQSMQKLTKKIFFRKSTSTIFNFENEKDEASNESLDKMNKIKEEDFLENFSKDSVELNESKEKSEEEINEKLNKEKKKHKRKDNKSSTIKFSKKLKNKKIIENLGLTLAKMSITNMFIQSLFQNGFDFFIPFDEIEKEQEIEQDDICFQLFMGKWQGKPIVIKCVSIDRIKYEIQHNPKYSKLNIAYVIQNYIKEINIYNNLRHPNILLFIGVSINKNDFYIILEYLENHTLYEILHKKKPIRKILKISEDKLDETDENKISEKTDEIKDNTNEDQINKDNLNISINNIDMTDNNDKEELNPTAKNITPYEKFHLLDEITQKKILFQIAYEISVALRYIHSRKIIHCNLKSNYLFLDEEYHVKLGNFFYSKLLNFFCDENKEEDYFMENKYEWTPPEILTNGKFGESSDVYRFGLILYEIFKGEIPHKSAGSSQIIGLNYIVSEKDTKSRYLVNLIQKCVSEDPKNRPNLEYISNFLYKYSKFYDKRDFSFEEFGNFILA